MPTIDVILCVLFYERLVVGWAFPCWHVLARADATMLVHEANTEYEQKFDANQ